jgi:pyrroline-5-carboxylate reductase
MAKFGFIGCGNMGGALAVALSKKISADSIVLFDVCEEKANTLSESIGGAKIATAHEVAAKCDYIFLGVKPQVLPSVLAELGDVFAKRKDTFALVSMAAGISTSAIETMCKASYPIIRIMPNTPACVGEGMILYCTNPSTSKEQLGAFISAMEMAGKLDEIDEGKIDAASALSGCGPAFVYMFAEALADGAVECGLARDKANIYAAQTLIGAAKMLLESGKHPGELKDAVCSPGGTTIAGVHALEDGAFRACVMDAVNAAYERTLELKK